MNAHAPQPSPEASHDASRPRLDLGKLRGIKFKDLVIRFMFGGTLSVFAAWIAHVTSLRFGGIFAAFPVVLLASLTIIGRREGAEPAAEDAQGGVAGACAFLVSASPLAFMLSRVPGGVALVAALAGWGVLALLLYYAGVAVGWLRTPGEQPDHATRDAGSATEGRDRSGAAGMEYARDYSAISASAEQRRKRMPYATTSDLPDSVSDALPAHAQEIYRAAFNNAWDQYANASERRGDESREEAAHKVAWAAVKREYHKDAQSERWVENAHA